MIGRGVRRIKSRIYLFPLIQPSPSGEGFKRNAFEQKAPAVKEIVD